MSGRRVVVTGLGAVTPVGNDVPSFHDALLAGRSGVGPVTLFDPATLPTRIAGEVRWPADAPLLRDRKISFALEASRQAVAGATASGEPLRGVGAVSLGVGLELFSLDDMVALRAGTPLPEGRADRLTFLQTPSDLCVHLLAARHGAAAPPRTHVSACAAGTDAIGAAFRLVRSGRADWALAGGTDSMINPLGLSGFCKLRAMSTRNDDPAAASRPFDRRRDGFVLGEGAGALVLERLDSALARGAAIHAEVKGYGCSFDAHGISEPHPDGRGAIQAIRRAIADAGLTPAAIDAVNAHATGTAKNDPIETLALEAVLGARAQAVPVQATKSMIGHLISAAGAVECVAAIGGLEAQRLHPTINLDEPDPACGLDYVAGQARDHAHRHVLKTSFGFGGQNAALVLAQWEGA